MNSPSCLQCWCKNVLWLKLFCLVLRGVIGRRSGVFVCQGGIELFRKRSIKMMFRSVLFPLLDRLSLVETSLTVFVSMSRNHVVSFCCLCFLHSCPSSCRVCIVHTRESHPNVQVSCDVNRSLVFQLDNSGSAKDSQMVALSGSSILHVLR